MRLPAGVKLLELTPHPDERGSFLEIFREEWPGAGHPVQWNAVRSAAGVLRGVHVHRIHDDYLTIAFGRASIGLRDLRMGSKTEGLTAVVPLSSQNPKAIVIPHGVAHGFLFHEPSLHIYAVSHYWNPADELGCKWDDPDLGIEWPERPLLVSERDASAQSFLSLVSELEPYQPL